MSLEYKILGQELVSYTDVPGTEDTTSYYVSYEESQVPIFVAIPTSFSSSPAYSTDGITWTGSTMPSAIWTSATHGNGKFVAVGIEMSAYSTDGITWTQTDMAIVNQWPYVTYGDGKFVVVFSGATALYSTDGINWTQSTLPSGQWISVTHGDGKFVAIASNSSSSSAYSTDGINWTQSTLPSGQWISVTHGDGKFVAVATSDMDTAVYSTDGITWTETGLPVGVEWRSVTHGDGKFVAVAYRSNLAAYSTNGITWNETTIESRTWISVAYGEIVQLTETLNIIGGQGTTQTEEFLPVTIYTVPTEKQTTVTSIFVANHDDTDSTYDLAVIPAGEELSLKHHIRWDMAVAAKDFENISTKITMSAGDKIVIFPSTVDTVSITAFGVEK